MESGDLDLLQRAAAELRQTSGRIAFPEQLASLLDEARRAIEERDGTIARLSRNLEQLAAPPASPTRPVSPEQAEAIERGYLGRAAGGLWVCPACSESIPPNATHMCKSGGARQVRVQNAPATRGFVVEYVAAAMRRDHSATARMLMTPEAGS